MINKKPLVIFILLFLFFPLLVIAESVVDVAAFADAVYLQEKNDSELRAEYDLLLPTLTDPYQIALAHYYMARAYQSFDTVEICIEHNRDMREGKFVSLFSFYNERKNAIKFYERALKIVEQQDETANWLALKADSISQLCLLKSVGYTMFNGLKVEKFSKETLKLDPKNATAQFLIASAKIYPPKVYFGNPPKALELLNAIQLPESPTKPVLFDFALGYAYTYARLGQKNEALLKIKEALAFYPTNCFANAVSIMIENDEIK